MATIQMVDGTTLKVIESHEDVVSTLAGNSPFMMATIKRDKEDYPVLIAKLHIVLIKP